MSLPLKRQSGLRFLSHRLIALAGFSFFLAFGIPLAQAEPPTDFQITQIVGSGLDGPSAFEFAPDGRIFILERTGTIRIYKNGDLLPQPFAVLPSMASGDRGLIGIAFDPDFLTNHYVYFYYTGTDLLNRLVRFDASDDIGTNGPFVLYQTSSPSEWLHVGGSIRFGPDGKLYFAVGDNGNPPLAQLLDNPHGKILRINKDGSIPADNPFVGVDGALGEIWAYGLRNPWRFQFDSLTGRLYTADVGNYTWEEINLIQKGGNYGWPINEGVCTSSCAGFTDPIYAYNHNGDSAAVTGGPIYRASLFPAEYQGALFFSDYAQGFIRYMELDAEGNNAGVFDFDTNAGSVVDLKVADDGSLYYLTYFPGRLYRISYATDNHVPIASASADVTSGVEPLTVQFSSAASSDPDDDPLTWLWDFGDGTTSTEADPLKTYSTPGTYVVELTVSDGTNIAQAVPIIIQVGTPPVVTIAEPDEGDRFRAGDTIRYQASAIDGAGNDLNDAAIVTDVFLHHATHIHPFQDNLIGRTNEFTLPSTGEAASDIWYEIRTTATDASGLATTVAVNIFPRTSDMDFITEPAGLSISLEGTPYATPHAVTGVVGFEREVSAPTIQEKDGQLYAFDHWSDGGAQQHTLSTPENDTTFTAYFHETTGYSAEYWDNKTLSGAPVLSRADPIVDFDWADGSPDPSVPADEFSARWTKTETLSGGTYQFTVTGDDGVRLFVDDVSVIDQWIDQGATTYQATKVLSAGEHAIRFEFYDAGGAAVARLGMVKVGDPANWQGKYWNTPGAGSAPVMPTTAPTLTRTDAAIDFDWFWGTPIAPIEADHFVAQWTKTATFESGTYHFTTTSDDGMRVYVDGNLVLDKWFDQGADTAYTTDVNMTAGDHALQVEYYENGGRAIARMEYVKISESPAGFTGEYFNNIALGGSPIVTRNDTVIDFDWGGGSPAPSLPVDNFSARWTRTEVLAAGTYQFTVTADDGARLIIDGTPVINQWIDQAPTTYTALQTLTAGPHTITMEYYERGGGAVARLAYAQTASQVDWQGKYWNTPGAGFAPAFPTTAPTLMRTDAAIDFDWFWGAPASAIAIDHFVAQWTKTETLLAGTYRFTTTSDDGMRVYLDDTLVLDKWFDQGADTTYTADVEVSAGAHTYRVEYYENGGRAIARMDVVKVSTPAPGSFAAEYFNTINLAGAATLVRSDAVIDFDWGGGSPGGSIPTDSFSARWTQTADFSAGTVRFTVTADDGVRLKVDGATVLDQWVDQPPTTYTVDHTFTAGSHTLVLEYYERGGGAVARLVQTTL